MQTVLGASGQIAVGLTRYLHDEVTHDLRLVSRRPTAVYDTDEVVAADLTDADATARAVAGSDVAYLTVGLPMDAAQWERQFPVMMANTIAACEQHGTRLVFFDNTYMYPRTSAPQVEGTPFEPVGRKSAVRAEIAATLLAAMRDGRVEAVICRAPEFYGPGRTASLTNTLVFDRIKAGRRPLVPLSARTRRSLIWTPDASRALGLVGNAPDAYGQTWHLPVDPARPTYAAMVEVASEVTGRPISAVTVPAAAFRLGGLVNGSAREVGELLPRYRDDNLFDCSKFTARFPDFEVTTHRSGIEQLLGA